MNIYYGYGLGITSAVAFILGISGEASAQEPGSNVATPPPSATPSALSIEPAGTYAGSSNAMVAPSDEPIIDSTTTRRTLPNRPLLITGTVVLGAAYAGSAVVAATSNREADEKLYYPVVGPWLDLNHRGCAANACSNRTLDRVLLVGDGVLQGVGALGMLLSLVVPEKTTRTWYLIGQRDVVVVPQFANSTLGLVSFGRF